MFMKTLLGIVIITLVIVAPCLAQIPLFEARMDFGVSGDPVSIKACDLNGDGLKDIITANWDSNNVSISRNNGDGTFQSAINCAVGRYASSVLNAVWESMIIKPWVIAIPLLLKDQFHYLGARLFVHSIPVTPRY
jgi:hypothetical protein